MTVEHMPPESRPTGDVYEGPKTCPACGTELGPGRVLIGWKPCNDCQGGRDNRSGHTAYWCRACEDEHVRTVCYYPPCTAPRT
jgi:hypothetical protein